MGIEIVDLCWFSHSKWWFSHEFFGTTRPGGLQRKWWMKITASFYWGESIAEKCDSRSYCMSQGSQKVTWFLHDLHRNHVATLIYKTKPQNMQNLQSQFSWKNTSDLNTSQHIQYSQILIPFRFEYASLVSCPLWNQHEATLNQQFVLVGSCNLDLICHPKKLGWFSELTFWPVTSGLCIQIQNYRNIFYVHIW